MKVQSVALTIAVTLGAIASTQACSVSEAPPGSGGSQGTSGTSNGASGANAAGGSGNTGGTTPMASCDNVTGCGGPITGKYNVASSCLKLSGGLNLNDAGLAPQTCTSTTISGTLSVTGSLTFTGSELKDDTVTTGNVSVELDKGCLNLSGTQITCEQGAKGAVENAGYKMGVSCTPRADGGCSCTGMMNQKASPGYPSPTPATTGNFRLSGNQVSLIGDATANYDYCIAGGNLTMTPKTGSATVITGTIALNPDTGSTGTGGAGSGGSGNTAGSGTGGSAGGAAAGAGNGGSGGGPPGTRKDGPCDIYAAANMPCAAAYSTVRSLLKAYTGPLIQVRNGSSATNNTGMGGMTKDIGQTADGYLDTAALTTFCMGSYCTVSKLYDQSGNKNDIGHAPSGNTSGGATGAEDDYESTIGTAKSQLMAGGHMVHSLYMAKHDGYRTARGMKATGVPMAKSPQTIYELADGTRVGGDGPCCWDFGNVTTDPKSYADMNTLFFGKAFWGNGTPPAPWFMADFEAGVWAGGSKVGDPGWGSLNDAHPVNPKDPSMAAAAFALGMLKTNGAIAANGTATDNWGLFAADTAKDSAMTTAFEGKLPKPISNAGGIVLGVGGDNSNNSLGTFYEGAIVSGYATTATDTAVLQNIKAVGYSK